MRRQVGEIITQTGDPVFAFLNRLRRAEGLLDSVLNGIIGTHPPAAERIAMVRYVAENYVPGVGFSGA
jgi:predicted Zn-dependent protease